MIPLLLLLQTIPMTAWQYRDRLRHEVAYTWGIVEPVSTFAAQIHQESAWDPLAESPFARGLSQFTPSTEDWFNQEEERLAMMGMGALDPDWAIRALVLYDRWLWERTGGVDRDNHWAFVLARYNGGGWTRKETIESVEKFGCCPLDYWGCAKRSCLRLPANCAQTWDYVDKILYRWRPLYEGW